MQPAIILLQYIWLEVLGTGPLDLPQLTSECRATYRIRQVVWFPWRMHINSGPSALVRLTSRFSSMLDASTSVFLSSFLENLALITASSRVRRCSGVGVEVGPASRRSWPSWRGVHSGGTPTSLVAIGLRLGVLPRLRRAWLPGLVAVGEVDEALDGDPPVVDLVWRWRVV